MSNRWRAGRIGSMVAAVALGAGCRSGVREFASLDDPAPFVRARAAGLDEQAPDPVAIPALIGHLEDSDPVVRLSASEALRRRTGRDFGYKAWGTPDERAESVARWRAWWDSQSTTTRSDRSGPVAGRGGPGHA